MRCPPTPSRQCRTWKLVTTLHHVMEDQLPGPDHHESMSMSGSVETSAPDLASTQHNRFVPKQVAIPGFSALRADLRFTLLDLVQLLADGDKLELEEVCRLLAIEEDQKPWEIRRKIYELSELKLVGLRRDGKWHERSEILDWHNLMAFKKFVAKVLHKNPGLNIPLKSWTDDGSIVSIPEVAPASSSLQQIRVLIVGGCSKLKEVDLSSFPALRVLSIKDCCELTSVTGWEVVTKLGWLEIEECRSYVEFPPVQLLPSLRECRLVMTEGHETQSTSSAPDDYRQCVQLRRLEISGNASSALNQMDLITLRFLEVLTLSDCDALTSIGGLSGLQSLTSLDLSWCPGVRRIPELRCLRALTRLDLSGTDLEEITEVQKLYSLTSLNLMSCESLTELPFLGHLKALATLNISYSGVEEIPGLKDLVSLATLDCECSELKWLPGLHHLRHLELVRVGGTPLSRVSSLFYLDKDEVYFDSIHGEGVGLIEVSDISDTE